MTDREVMQMALEALEKTMSAWGGTCAWHRDVKIAITAIRARLAEPEPKCNRAICQRGTDGYCDLT